MLALRLLLVATATPAAAAYSLGSDAARQQLRGLFGGGADPVLACPVTKAALTPEVTVVGGLQRRSLATRSSSYPVNDVYADLTPRSTPTIGL